MEFNHADDETTSGFDSVTVIKDSSTTCTVTAMRPPPEDSSSSDDSSQEQEQHRVPREDDFNTEWPNIKTALTNQEDVSVNTFPDRCLETQRTMAVDDIAAAAVATTSAAAVYGDVLCDEDGICAEADENTAVVALLDPVKFKTSAGSQLTSVQPQGTHCDKQITQPFHMTSLSAAADNNAEIPPIEPEDIKPVDDLSDCYCALLPPTTHEGKSPQSAHSKTSMSISQVKKIARDSLTERTYEECEESLSSILALYQT